VSGYRTGQALGSGLLVYDPEGRQIGHAEDAAGAERIIQTAKRRREADLCLEVGTTDDGLRWACCHPAGHVRYWFDHLALTGIDGQPVVTWRRNDAELARYLAPVERGNR
jgi:hypothetical protein